MLLLIGSEVGGAGVGVRCVHLSLIMSFKRFLRTGKFIKMFV